LLAPVQGFWGADMTIVEEHIDDVVLEHYAWSMTLWSGGVVVRFADAGDAVEFAMEDGCMASGMCGVTVTEFVTSQMALSLTRDFTQRMVMYVAIFFGVVAMIIMAGTLGRVIGDERQATAIYRAVGATRADIRKIYLVYVMILAGISAMSAVVIGYVMAAVMHVIYAKDLTVGARRIFGLVDSVNEVSLVGFDVEILVVCAAILVTGMVCVLLCADKMMSKSVMKDMRS